MIERRNGAKHTSSPGPEAIGVMEVEVKRNDLWSFAATSTPAAAAAAFGGAQKWRLFYSLSHPCYANRRKMSSLENVSVRAHLADAYVKFFMAPDGHPPAGGNKMQNRFSFAID